MKTTTTRFLCAVALMVQPTASASILSAVGNSKPNLESSFHHANFAPPKFIRNETQALPTNTWWGNLIHTDKAYPGNHIQPIWSNPYALRVYPGGEKPGVHVFYPYTSRHVGGPSANEKAARYYLHGQVIETILSSREMITAQSSQFQVVDWDDVGVRVQFTLNDQPDAYFQSAFVSGMAYITAEYHAMQGVIASPYEVRSIQGVEFPKDKSTFDIRPGQQIVVEYMSGGTWGIFATVPLTLRYNQAENSLESTSVFTGALRVTRMMENKEDFALYSTCIVQGADLKVESNVRYGWTWKTKGDCSNGLLHYALHHHIETLAMENVKMVTKLNRVAATRGPMTALVTTGSPLVWRFNEPETIDIGFYPKEAIDTNVAKDLKLEALLRADIEADGGEEGNSYYFTGKKVQLYASLCLMANDENVVQDGGKLLGQCLVKLRTAMARIIDNSLKHPLVYDEVYRGLISMEAFNENDPWRDFGNSMYNDHHYHYGYWIVAASILRNLDPEWERMPQLIDTIEYMIRDVANPNDQEDVWFPRFRHFDWYLGHSYSHGISPFADGKDQESTSEDINFDYGMMLWGQMAGNKDMEELAKIMMKVNSRAIKTYFLMTDDNPIHPQEIIRNKVTGIFFDNKVDYATWFSPHRHCIHGIQMLPVSPITEIFRSRQFVQEEWDQVISKVSIITDPKASDPWQSLLYANYATINKQEAIEKLKVVPMDDGLTRSWALYIAATRTA